MQTEVVKVREIEFGKGMPKICVPIVAPDKEGILLQAKEILAKAPDCVELRIDWFENVKNPDKVLELLKELRKVLGNTVLLFTFRTEREGGKASISGEEYIYLCETVCKSGYVDLIDVEAYMKEGLLHMMCKRAHQSDVYVVASNHDFTKTPSEEEIVKRLQFMDDEGADILKIAVMPEKMRDVVTLLSATLKYRELGGIKPVITMSMGRFGAISRLTGESFGSAVTFAAVEKTSAPGQVPIDEVRQVLKVIHKHG